MGQEAERLAQGGGAALDQFPLARRAHAARQRFAQRPAGERLVQRLLQNLLHMTLVDRGHRHVFVGIGRDQQPGHMAIPVPHLREQRHAIAPGHAVVGDQNGHLVPARRQQRQRVVHTAGGEHDKLVAVESREPLAGLRLVVHQQHRVGHTGIRHQARLLGCHAGLGRSKVNSVQAPGSLSTASTPPWRCTMP
jgi:hypothetical protein